MWQSEYINLLYALKYCVPSKDLPWIESLIKDEAWGITKTETAYKYCCRLLALYADTIKISPEKSQIILNKTLDKAN